MSELLEADATQLMPLLVKESYKYTNLYSRKSLESRLLYLKNDRGLSIFSKDERLNGYRYYFACNSIEHVEIFLNAHLEKLIVMDIVEKKNYQPLSTYLKEKGLNPYRSLSRMVSANNEILDYHKSNNIYFASTDDVNYIIKSFLENFDINSEQIPNNELIKEYINQKKVIVYKIQGINVGFIIYDLMGKTQILKYWFVDENYRKLGIGSDLYKQFQWLGRQCSKRLLWVLDDNTQVIKKYVKLNYKYDNLINNVYIK